jgi:hypothetical protein
MAFACLGFCIMTGMTIYYRAENRRRDKVEGGRPIPGTQLETLEKFDLAPGKSSLGSFATADVQLIAKVSDTSPEVDMWYLLDKPRVWVFSRLRLEMIGK